MENYYMKDGLDMLNGIELDCINDLICAMRFKAEHIRAKADPAIFSAVADMLEQMKHERDDAVAYLTETTRSLGDICPCDHCTRPCDEGVKCSMGDMFVWDGTVT